MTTDNAERRDYQDSSGARNGQRRMYLMFGGMILTSTAVMFLLTYTNAFSIDHVRWSEERFYMALLMGSAMAIIMLLFMRAMMYRNLKVNIAIMDGMIPHHSIAILTSMRANIDDLRVRELADGIIQAQEDEIAEMKWLIEDIAVNGKATTQEDADQRPVPDFSLDTP